MEVGPNIAFGIIAFAMVVATLFLLSTRNIVHAALYLMVVLAGTAALFLLLGAEFLGWTQVIVYIGAIVILFLFGVMLTKAQLGESEELDNKLPQRILGVISAMLVFGLLAAVFVSVFGGDEIVISSDPVVELEAVTEYERVDELEQIELPGGTHVVVTDEHIEEVREIVVDFGQKPGVLDRQATAADLGNDLFQNWVLPFEAISVVLLAALIGSIVLARRDDPGHVLAESDEFLTDIDTDLEGEAAESEIEEAQQ